MQEEGKDMGGWLVKEYTKLCVWYVWYYFY